MDINKKVTEIKRAGSDITYADRYGTVQCVLKTSSELDVKKGQN